MREDGGMTLTEFLLARIEEDEHDATWSPNTGWDETSVAAWAGKTPGNLAARHAGRWSPERVLAECAAKRAIVEAAVSPQARGRLDGVLMALAVIYANHPEYRDEWRP